jgi:hypothetical protein
MQNEYGMSAMSPSITTAVSDIEIFQAQLANLSDADRKSLHEVYILEWCKLAVRDNGWVNIILGGITVLLGASVLEEFSIPKLIQFLLGLLGIAQCIWALVAPHYPRFREFAILLLIAAVWNVFIGFNNGAWLVIILGLLQLWWSYVSYRLFRFYQQYPFGERPAHIVKLYHDLWHSLMRGSLKREANVINVWIKLLLWRIWLIDNLAVVASNSSRLLIIRRKDELNFIPFSKKPMGRWRVNGRMIIKTFYERSVMRGKDFEKYAHWKGLETILAQVGPSTWERLPRAIQIVLRLIGILILLFVIYVIAEFIDLFIRYG